MRYLAPLLLLTTTVISVAAPKPINDGSSNTLLLAENFGSYANQGGPSATAELDEPPCGGAPAEHTVWYRYVAPVKGRFIVVIDDDQGLRADLRIPGNPPGTVPLQTVVDGTSNTIAFDEEKLSTDLERGQTVYLRVDAAEPFDFSWRFVEAVNDFYEDATVCAGASGTVRTTDRGATRSAYEADLGLETSGIWFAWTAPTTGSYSFDLVGSRALHTSSYAGFSLRAYGEINGFPALQLAEASGSTLDNSTVVTLNAVAGQTYYFVSAGPTGSSENRIWFSWYPATATGVLVWSDDHYRVNEGAGTSPARALRLRGSTGEIGTGFSTAPGTGPHPATPGEDYFPLSPLAALFIDGVRTEVFSAHALQDSEVEPEENYYSILSHGAPEGSTAQVLISSDDGNGACGFATNIVRVREGETAYLPIARLSPGSTYINGRWKVNGGTATAGADWTTGHGEFVLPSDGTSNTIAFPTEQDGDFEGDETVVIELLPNVGPIADGSSNTLLIIEDDDYFVARAGKYCGTIHLNGYGALVKFALTDLGSATGTVEYRGLKYVFRGVFDGHGQLTASLPRARRTPLGLRLKFGAGWDLCDASVRDPEGVWADGVVRRLPYDGKRTIAPQASKYTIACTDSADLATKAIFTGAVLGDGSVRFVGKTADATPVALGGVVGFGGEFAFNAALYKKAGNFHGTFDFGLGPQQPGEKTSQWWLKPWRQKDAIYPALPLQECVAAIRRFTPPPGSRVTNFADGSVRFVNGGTILDGTSNTIQISEQNRVRFPSENSFAPTLLINPKTGLFTGRVTRGHPTTFYGVFLQDSLTTTGCGFYLGDGIAGDVFIEEVTPP